MSEHPTLQIGDPAPALHGQDHDGAAFELASLRGQPVIVYFYPKDDTPGCTTQACDLRDNMARFEAAGVRVIGCSPDSVARHAKFRAKYGLNFTLIADPEHANADAWGVWREKKSYGKVYSGIVRSTFVVDAQGRLAAIYDNVRAAGHADRLAADGWMNPAGRSDAEAGGA